MGRRPWELLGLPRSDLPPQSLQVYALRSCEKIKEMPIIICNISSVVAVDAAVL